MSSNRRIPWKKLPDLTLVKRLRSYKTLSKSRLTFLVTLTAMAGYAICPESPTIDETKSSRTIEELKLLLSTASGVALCSASANAINQLLEVPLDSQMTRTRIRPLCTRILSPLHVTFFAAITGIAGVSTLMLGVNSTSAYLGLANIILYSGIYTPLKRVHAVNTWIGSIVGAIPPLIGWTASSGSLAPISNDNDSEKDDNENINNIHTLKSIASITALPYVLYTWQFPHFNSLAHLLRPQYASSGYSMLSVSNPLKNSVVSLRHSLIMLPLTAYIFPWSGLTTWSFAVTSTIINSPFAYLSYVFYKDIKNNKPGDISARRLFHASLIHLPLTMVLAMYHKRSQASEYENKDNKINNNITIES